MTSAPRFPCTCRISCNKNVREVFPMRRFSSLVLMVAVLSLPLRAQQTIPPYKDAHLSIEDRVADLLSRMTLEEKVAQVAGGGRGSKGLVDTSGKLPYKNVEQVQRQQRHAARESIARGVGISRLRDVGIWRAILGGAARKNSRPMARRPQIFRSASCASPTYSRLKRPFDKDEQVVSWRPTTRSTAFPRM